MTTVIGFKDEIGVYMAADRRASSNINRYLVERKFQRVGYGFLGMAGDSGLIYSINYMISKYNNSFVYSDLNTTKEDLEKMITEELEAFLENIRKRNHVALDAGCDFIYMDKARLVQASFNLKGIEKIHIITEQHVHARIGSGAKFANKFLNKNYCSLEIPTIELVRRSVISASTKDKGTNEKVVVGYLKNEDAYPVCMIMRDVESFYGKFEVTIKHIEALTAYITENVETIYNTIVETVTNTLSLTVEATQYLLQHSKPDGIRYLIHASPPQI